MNDDVRDLIEKLAQSLGPSADVLRDDTIEIEWGMSLLRITVAIVPDDVDEPAV